VKKESSGYNIKVILAIFVDKSVPEENYCCHKQNKPNFESEIKA
jgi:hypothetical protein